MFRAIVLIVSLYAVLVSGDEELAKMCKEFAEKAMRCCSAKPKGTLVIKAEEMNECFEKYPSPNCEVEECIAKKLGYYGGGGKLNKEAYTSVVEKQFEANPELLEAIKTNCLNADILNKGSPHTCDFAKMNNCLLMQYVDGCTEWSNEKPCDETEIKKSAELCMTI